MSLPGPPPEPAPVRRRVRGTACRPRPRGALVVAGHVHVDRCLGQARQRDRDAGGRAAPHAGDDPSGQGAAFGGGGEGDRVRAQAQQCAGLGLPVGASDLGLRGVRGDGAATHRHQRRRPDHPGHRARQQVRATEERRSEAARWPLPQVLGGVHVHQSGVAHHRDPVGEREGLRLVVRDVQHRGVRQRGAQFLQFGEHALTQLRVQCREGLVEQQHPGPDRQRAGNRHALLLASRQFPRKALAVRGHPDHRECVGHASGDLGTGNPVRAKPERDVLGHPHVREQGVGLDDDADPALRGWQIGDVSPVEADRPRRRAGEAGQRLERGGLARAAGTEQRDGLAARDPQVEVDQGPGGPASVSVRDVHPVECDGRKGRVGSVRRRVGCLADRGAEGPPGLESWHVSYRLPAGRRRCRRPAR